MEPDTRHEAFRVGAWEVDPVSGLMTQGSRSVRLEPRVMAMLVYLAQRPHRVIPRQELEQAVWHGRTVSYDALTTAMLKLRRALDDDAREPQYIETVSKRGYRLLAPVSPSEKAGERKPETAFTPVEAPAQGVIFLVIRISAGVLILGALLILGLVLWIRWQAPVPPAETAPFSIAVLPFDNLSEARTEDYFADGMTDDLITDLAKNPRLFVIARDSVFLYKDRVLDPQAVARRLHVRYLLKGSVRRTADRVRINVQLIDAASATHLWAEHYEGNSDDLFALQDAIGRKILAALKIELEGDVDRQRRSTDPRAYDYFLDGRNRFFSYASKEENLKARDLYLQAIKLDPEFAMAYAMLAWTHTFEAMNGWSSDREASLGKGLTLAQRSLALDDEQSVAYFVTGLVYRERGNYQRAREEAEKALALEPSYANAHVLLATLLYYTGQPEAGLAMIKRAIRLNPHHPYNYPFHLGQAYFILGDYRAAIDAFASGLESNPSSERLHVWLAAAYARAGELENARWEAEQVMAYNPEFSLGRISEAFPFQDEADLQLFVEALRLAGLSR
ncbi:MAG: tetratricopeptide repeat protein [Candidatus Thiodiazotropha sp.]